MTRGALYVQAIRGPLVLITLGALFAMHQAGVISFARTWPLIIIVVGLVKLFERLLLRPAYVGGYPPAGYVPGAYPPGAYAPGTYAPGGYSGGGYTPQQPPQPPSAPQSAPGPQQQPPPGAQGV